MSFQPIGKKINKDEIKKIGSLNAQQLSIKASRDRELSDIIRGTDNRLLLIIGPCSADNESAVLEYAHRLARLQEEVKEKIFIVMRVYTAKPRTKGEGYKGLIHETRSSGEGSLIEGIKAARKLHHTIISETGLTTADEMLYTENLPLFDDVVSYITVGARSVEDQLHRFVASGIDAPVGMKNPTSGNLNVMLNAIYASQKPQSFLYNHEEVLTTGNPLAHGILRGGMDEAGQSHPNCSKADLLKAVELYKAFDLANPFIIVDANHDNSGKNYLEQMRIVTETLKERKSDECLQRYVRGFMIESYLEDGKQEAPAVFGKSITDPCLGWGKTQELVREAKKLLS